jgi:UDP-N-acetylglucosamine 1-carboxyvinyltransferase
MDSFRIQGGRRLAGRIQIEGSKNAALPLMAAALMTDGELTLRNVPCLSDISNMARLLRALGVEVDGDCGTVKLRVMDHNKVHAHYDIVKTMRASICVLGPLLARRRRAVIAMPGGCAFGSRPIDLHLRGMEALGAKIELTGGDIIATAPEGLKGTTIFLGGPNGSTVLGTANVMCAAVLAQGRTVIECAACEPEVADLAHLLNKMGARIEGIGSPRLVIHGVEQLGKADHTVIPDRIVAGTYAVAAAVTNGDVILEEFPYDCMLSVIDRFNEIGVHCELIEGHEDPLHGAVRVTSERSLRPTQITTQPHPGFPTDLQAQFMTLLCLAGGNSIITEKIYPERFMHVSELARMGAQIHRQGPTCVVTGGAPLRGAPVMASDLRASACLVLAGLVAEGETNVSRIYHLDRGYTRMEEQLNVLGARIERVREESGAKTEPASSESSSSESPSAARGV